ncbi:hypothetical protein BKA56DRAFT_696491 [Ilyonectria sp. MPI-CAGE-AT-0026]|nr:hypothetical protein BKA56DRAFT_696491 [Ilyonectria sp. MPI-CAGE-AT-0026]
MSFNPTPEALSRINNLLFKNTDYLKILSGDLVALCKNHEILNTAYLVLLVHDWNGDAAYRRQELLRSLRRHEPINETEVRFHESNIILNIAGCIGRYYQDDNWIELEDPTRLFKLSGGQLWTYALHVGSTKLQVIHPDMIGGIEGRSPYESVRDIASIKMELGDGRCTYEVFIRKGITVKVMNMQTVDGKGNRWITRWRVVGSNEREWWPQGAQKILHDYIYNWLAGTQGWERKRYIDRN